MIAFGRNASVAGLLTFGTITSLFSKIVYEVQSEGLDGEVKFFRKPWAMTTIMFMGMSLCLPLAFLEERQKAAAAAEEAAREPLLASHDNVPHVAKRSEMTEALWLAIPTVFDLAATVLMNVGLLTVTASVYQMMRGAEMLFAAVLAVLFLHRRLNRNHYGGIVCCVVGIVLVGQASLLSGEGSAVQKVSQEQILRGMTLIVLSQAVQAAQITFEDYFMSELSIAPMKIVGYEGVIGTTIMLGVMAPLVRMLPGVEGEGIHEDIVDTVHMITHSHQLPLILTIQMLALLAYNYMGMSVTGHLGAVFRTVLETMRTLFVWLVDLALFYGGAGLGESWTQYSWMQAAGFLVLVTGTLVYGSGDEVEAKRVVEEYMANVEVDRESQNGDAMLLPPQSGSVPIGMRPVPAITQPIMMSPSPMGASHSMAAGSYREAVASSFRGQGMSYNGGI